MHRVSGPPLIVTQQVHNIPVPIQIYFYLSIICSDTNILLSVYHLFWYKYIPIYTFVPIQIYFYLSVSITCAPIQIYWYLSSVPIQIYWYLSTFPIQIYWYIFVICSDTNIFLLSINCSETNVFLSIYHLFRYKYISIYLSSVPVLFQYVSWINW